MTRIWALCWVCGLLLASEAWAAAPPKPAEVPQVLIDLTVARTKRGEFTSGRLNLAKHGDCRRRVEKGVQEGRVKVVSTPRLVTLSGTSSSFLAGGERPVEFRDASGHAATRYEVIGTRVTTLPTVREDGSIHSELEAEWSGLSPKGGHLSTCRFHTGVEMSPGEAYLVVLHVPGEEAEGEGYDLLVLCTAKVIRPPQNEE